MSILLVLCNMRLTREFLEFLYISQIMYRIHTKIAELFYDVIILKVLFSGKILLEYNTFWPICWLDQVPDNSKDFWSYDG